MKTHMTTARKYAAALLIAALIGGLFATNKLPPLPTASVANAAASGATTNSINANGQLVSLFVPAGGAVRVGISGTFVGTLSFKLSQDGGTTTAAVNLFNMTTGAATDQSTTGTGSWYYAPTSTNDGMLIIQATAWTSGTAIVSIVDLVATRATTTLVLLPSAARGATGTTSQAVNNPLGRGAVLYLNITAASGTGGLQLNVQFQDPVSGSFNDYVAPLPASPITATGLKFFFLFPGGSTSGNDSTGAWLLPMPSQFRVKIIGGDTSSYTYSVAVDLLPAG